MKTLAITASVAGFALTIFPAFFVFAQKISWNTHAALMAVGMVLWFGSAPFWMKKS
jgi:hypothetical protein